MDSQRITLYIEGDELCEAMLADIARAENAVRLESYIFAGDAVGERFIQALLHAAAQRFLVTLRVDAAGSWDTFSTATEQRLRAGGVRVMRCRRWNWRRFWVFQRRNHRKLLVVDERVAYLGGFNLHNQISRTHFGDGRWRDTHVRIEGELAGEARMIFDSFGHRPGNAARGGDVMLVPNRGLKGRLILPRLLRQRFAAARARIWLTSPYFVPDLRSQLALMRAAKRGVDVRCLVPGKSDVRIAQWASRAAYAPLLAAGVRIYEYQPRVLHAKTVLVDDTWGTVGTANFDYRSFFINDELNAMFTRTDVLAELERMFTEDLAQAEEIRARAWQRRSWTMIPGELIGWLARRWL